MATRELWSTGQFTNAISRELWMNIVNTMWRTMTPNKLTQRAMFAVLHHFFKDNKPSIPTIQRIDFDNDTMFCLSWFESNGWAAGKFGDADVLARAKGTSAAGLAEAGVVASGGGEVRLLRWQDMPEDWNPLQDKRKPVWESLHQLIRSLNLHGEDPTGKLLALCGMQSGAIRSLAYRLYTLCERKGWAEDARAYNELVVAWPNIEQASIQVPVREQEQGSLL